MLRCTGHAYYERRGDGIQLDYLSYGIRFKGRRRHKKEESRARLSINEAESFDLSSNASRRLISVSFFFSLSSHDAELQRSSSISPISSLRNEMGHNAESWRSSGFPISSSRDETGCYPVGKTLFDESDLKQMGLTPEKLNDMWVRQREKACRAAVDLENRRCGSKVYELVEAICHKVIMFNGVWHHVNFKAHSKTPDVDVYSSPKLFFAEVDSYKREITSFKCLENAGDPAPTNGCACCSPDAPLLHPSDGDFVLGSPNDAARLAYVASHPKS